MKIFVLLSRVPYPTEKGDKLRAFHQIRCLSANNEVILCALSDVKVHPDALKVLGEFCSQIHIIPISKPGMAWNVLKAVFNGNPFQIGYFYRCKAAKKINRLISETRPDHIFCQLIRMAEYVKNQNIPKTLDYQDVFSVGVKRRAATSPVWQMPLWMVEYRRMLRYEKNIFDFFDHKTIISQPDRELISHSRRDEIVIVPNGVEHEYFYPFEKTKEYDVVFTGNMGYPPNVDAARFIADEIFPLLLKQFPNASLLISGANPHPKVLALQSDKVTVSGWVPDIRESYAKSRIFIAPMRIGTGLQNKLLEAMAMGLPCITSLLANQALGAKENEEILVGHTASEYASHIIRLLQDSAFAEAMAKNGHEYVKRIFSWENSTRQLESLFLKSLSNQTPEK